jgi:hypothetical protein
MGKVKKPTVRWMDGVLHIETSLGIINIRPRLVDTYGHHVDSIEVLPDANVQVDPSVRNIRLILKR